jgi:hypothetical protein
MALVNYQIIQALEDSSSIFITDYFTDSSYESKYLKQFSANSGVPYLLKRDLESQIDIIESILKKRIEDNMAGIYNDNAPIVGTIAYIQNSPDMKKNQFNQPSKLMVKIQNILKEGPYYGIHLIVYAHNYKGLIDVMDNSFVSYFGNRVILQGGNIGLQLVQESETLTDGTALLVTEDETTTYEQDPVMIYNECRSNALQDDVLDYIFSIYNQE